MRLLFAGFGEKGEVVGFGDNADELHEDGDVVEVGPLFDLDGAIEAQVMRHQMERFSGLKWVVRKVDHMFAVLLASDVAPGGGGVTAEGYGGAPSATGYEFSPWWQAC